MKKYRNPGISVLLVLTLLVLNACNSNIRHGLGIARQSPDAFKVVSNPPLSVPPNFSLRAPLEGLGNNNIDVTKQAETALFSTEISTSGKTSNGETALLNMAKAAEADPDIAKIVDKEFLASQAEDTNKNLLERTINKIRQNKIIHLK